MRFNVLTAAEVSRELTGSSKTSSSTSGRSALMNAREIAIRCHCVRRERGSSSAVGRR